MRNLHITFDFVEMIVLCVLLLGCTTYNGVPVSPTVSGASVDTIVPSRTVLPTVTYTITPSLTSTPFLPTSTPTPTPTMPFTSPPTMTTEERQSFTQELFRSNFGCKLPCWWGITPGITPWSEVDAFLHHLGAVFGSNALADGSIYHGTGGFDFEAPDYIIVNSIGFLERESIIDLINIRSDGYSNPVAFQEQWARYSPQQIMKEYGIPSRVWLESASSGPVTEGRIAGYTLWVFYDQFGFLILYNGYGEFEPVFHFCPRFENGQDIRAIEMYLQSPDNSSPIEKTAGIIGFVPAPYPHVQTIDDAAGLSVAELYQLFIQEDNLPCFDTPKDIWP